MVLFFILPLFSQTLKEAQLPKPNQFSLNYLNSLGERNILYGQTPPNFNGDVIIFNHGYIGSTESMLIGNEMYELAYNAGYKTAFVATTRGEGLWVNGEVLGRAIDQITEHYSVSEAFLVVHSNGGKASEVALFHENKRNKIKKVISLGTPFHGTQLADLSQNWWFNWLWSLTGLNDGAALSTSYYCEGIVRPYFDKHPLNQPYKYYNLGTWGWNKGHTLLVPAFVTAGAYIKFNGGGANDGVTPYYSSQRPGGNIILPNDESENGHYDHLDILYGQYSWKYIQPFLRERNQSNRNNMQNKDISTTTDYEVTSDYQIVYSQNEYDEIILQNDENVEITVFHENPQANFSIGKNNSRSARINDYTTQISVDKLKNSHLKIESDSKYVAIVKEPQKTSIKYRFEKGEKYPMLSLNVLNDQQEKEVQVSAVITKTTDLYGNSIVKPHSEIINFKWNESAQEFQLETNRFSEGVYALYLTAQLENHFKRNIASGFIVGEIPVDIKKIEEVKPQEKLARLVQSSFDTQIIVKDGLENTEVTVSIYDLSGRLILNKLVKVSGAKIILTRELQSFSKGIYLVKIATKEGNQTLKFIKK